MLLLRFQKVAWKHLESVPKPDRERIRARIDAYRRDPEGLGHDVARVIGEAGTLRLRVGVWRIIFSVRGDTMHIHRVAHRREAYR